MNLLGLLISAGGIEDAPMDEHTRRLEHDLRRGARLLASEKPSGLRRRVMEEVARAPREFPPATDALHRSTPGFWTPVGALAVAAIVLALLWLRPTAPEGPSTAPPPIAELRREAIDLFRPLLRAPSFVDDELAREAQNLFEDSQRMVVMVLPSTLRKPLESR